MSGIMVHQGMVSGNRWIPAPPGGVCLLHQVLMDLSPNNQFNSYEIVESLPDNFIFLSANRTLREWNAPLA